MPAYGIGHLRNVNVGPDIVAYLERIDATLEPYGGRFLIHGGRPEVLEGSWTGDLIVIEFPDADTARAWYESDAYQELIPLRAENSDGDILIIDGVSAGHRAPDVLAA
jgi:uncharacterized protein (DUF1330 family)